MSIRVGNEIALWRKNCGNPGRGYEMCHGMRCECGMVQCSEVLPINGLSLEYWKDENNGLDIKVFIRSEC